MTTRLTEPLRREIDIDGEPYTVTISAEGVRIARKRFREGRALTWRALLERGDAPDTPEGPAGPTRDGTKRATGRIP